MQLSQPNDQSITTPVAGWLSYKAYSVTVPLPVMVSDKNMLSLLASDCESGKMLVDCEER